MALNQRPYWTFVIAPLIGLAAAIVVLAAYKRRNCSSGPTGGRLRRTGHVAPAACAKRAPGALRGRSRA